MLEYATGRSRSLGVRQVDERRAASSSPFTQLAHRRVVEEPRRVVEEIANDDAVSVAQQARARDGRPDRRAPDAPRPQASARAPRRTSSSRFRRGTGRRPRRRPARARPALVPVAHAGRARPGRRPRPASSAAVPMASVVWSSALSTSAAVAIPRDDEPATSRHGAETPHLSSGVGTTSPTSASRATSDA